MKTAQIIDRKLILDIRTAILTEHFAGIVAGEAVSEAELLKLIAHLPQGTTEVMMHIQASV